MFANMVRSQITTFNDVLHEIQSALSKYQYNVCYLCNWDIWVIKKTFSNPYHTNIALASFSRLSMDWFKGKFTELILHSSTISGWRFGTWILFFHILGIIIPTDFHIFQRGRSTTNQMMKLGIVWMSLVYFLVETSCTSLRWSCLQLSRWDGMNHGCWSSGNL